MQAPKIYMLITWTPKTKMIAAMQVEPIARKNHRKSKLICMTLTTKIKNIIVQTIRAVAVAIEAPVIPKRGIRITPKPIFIAMEIKLGTNINCGLPDAEIVDAIDVVVPP